MYGTLNRAEFFSPVGSSVATTTKTPSQINGNSFANSLLAAAGLAPKRQTAATSSITPFNAYMTTGNATNTSRQTSPLYNYSPYASTYGQQYSQGAGQAKGAYGSSYSLTNPRQSGDSDDSGLPDPISTYDSSYFNKKVLTSGEEDVGSDIFQFHFPHITEKDGVYYAYYIDHSGGAENEVGLATSTDGVNFEYQGKVLTRGEEYDAEQASFPSVQYDEDTSKWYMLYEGKSAEGDVNSVCLAESDDGVNWTKKGPIISPGDAGEMSSIDAGTPTFFKEDGAWHVYFHGLADDGRVRIGYASGESLEDLTVSKEPLLDVDSSGAESGTVGARSNIIKKDGWYYMAYETSTAEKQYSEAQWGISIARSRTPDGDWEKLASGPILSNPEEGFGYDGPELTLDGDHLYLYYRTPENSTARTEIYGLGSMKTASYA